MLQRKNDGGKIMEKYIYDEKNGLHYKLVGDYYLPRLEAPGALKSAFGATNAEYISASTTRRFTPQC